MELFLVLLSLCFLALLIVLVFIMNRIMECIEELSFSTSRENKAHTSAVEAKLVSEGAVLPPGLYQPNEDDANKYMQDKVDELRRSRMSPYLGWDWSAGDKEEDST